ncbi:excinuclease ABC subunit UvrC [Helicobacter sp. MIT 14-3879]|uniref:excinuclease ABC subunit UvrC n=1 Tax=Helicobacter sp. MIT 14-3879 TaxID=2040649 RepID=UPI000E1E653E|nr:excinuclease ABC subunit UvrC [Helicobacter sp. MIT 14-3879]RDU61429.1 excinuclease ABC subunit C [Helicobacter sp. MIT 14-3879]
MCDKEHLAKQLQELPSKAGIYQYYDKDNKLLYVGKAKNLKKRILSYFNKDLSPSVRHSPRIQYMIAQTYTLQTFVVENEKDALILENSFIKSQNPKYNILLRDDKTYPYICINTKEKYPRFVITRRIESKRGNIYFGPYPRGAKEILNSLYEIFPLVQQASCLKGRRACLYYQIEKCLGVCEFDSQQIQAKYHTIIREAIKLMKNKYQMQKELSKYMLDFASKELFEQAQNCKNCIEILNELEHFSTLDLKKPYYADTLSFVIQGKEGILLKLFIRDGKVASTHHVFMRLNIPKNYRDTATSKHQESCLQTDEFELEVYTQALLKIMQDKTLAKEIIIANITDSNFTKLQHITQHSLQDSIPKLIAPKKGHKLQLAKLANLNALYLLNNRQKFCVEENTIIDSIAELFLLKREISSIEVFDTSHHGGSFCVGAMISYVDNGFCKEQYRHYNLSGKDEYSQMREMLTRRALSFNSLSPPDLWLLDGGQAQINIALEILESSNANTEVLAIAKEKRDFKAYRAKAAAKDILRSKDLEFRLDSKDSRLHFLQKLRDEAHRFAITFHRHKKTKGIH